MTTYHNYLVTSLDLHMVNLEEFKYGGTNVTAFRLLDPEREEVRQVVPATAPNGLRAGDRWADEGRAAQGRHLQRERGQG